VSILAYALRRLLWAVPLLLLVMLATYALLRGMGGDPFVQARPLPRQVQIDVVAADPPPSRPAEHARDPRRRLPARAPGVILGEAFLSVLGLGPNPPTPTWGNMAIEGVRFHRIWNVALPSGAIAAFAILANLLADSLQEALDPRRAGVEG